MVGGRVTAIGTPERNIRDARVLGLAAILWIVALTIGGTAIPVSMQPTTLDELVASNDGFDLESVLLFLGTMALPFALCILVAFVIVVHRLPRPSNPFARWDRAPQPGAGTRLWRIVVFAAGQVLIWVKPPILIGPAVTI